tara:strand:+ start:500 stop:841 length:342 start_codon:yes stop_codon:yes gene_type:complete
MIYEVKVFKPSGKLKKVISSDALVKRLWSEEMSPGFDTRCGPESSTKKIKALKKNKHSPHSKVWCIQCATPGCGVCVVKRRASIKYCTQECRHEHLRIIRALKREREREDAKK